MKDKGLSDFLDSDQKTKRASASALSPLERFYFKLSKGLSDGTKEDGDIIAGIRETVEFMREFKGAKVLTMCGSVHPQAF